jgi:L-lactate dehydrogenase complex protein LldG
MTHEKTRESILSRVRSALSQNDPAELDTAPGDQARAYRQLGVLTAEQRLQLFENRLHEYGARVFHSTEQDLQREIAHILLDGQQDGQNDTQKTKLVHPAGIPASWLSDRIDWSVDEKLSFAEIERFDGVLTGATAAVAESGSIVLQHGPMEGRRALTLLPDYHLCVLYGNQIVETLPECIERLQKHRTLPTTFISGPSATADIEMTRIKGVHGPRFLDVVLLRV